MTTHQMVTSATLTRAAGRLDKHAEGYEVLATDHEHGPGESGTMAVLYRECGKLLSTVAEELRQAAVPD